MRSKKVDIDLTYRNTRVIIHIFLWLILYFVMCFLNHAALFSQISTDKINLLINFNFICAIFINHYFLFPILLRSVKQHKWLKAMLFFFIIYISSVLIALFPLYYLAHNYPENKKLAASYEFFAIRSLWDIFGYKPLLWTFTFVFFWNFATILIQTAYNLYKSQKEKLSMLQEKNNMELNFLRMQIQPHFLFNTLNNIYGMVLDNEQAANSVTKLSELLRFSLSGSKKEWISLQEEILFLTNYIDLERIRHRPEKVQINSSFSALDADNKHIKPLLLVNFIENAFKHGVNRSIGTSWVDIQLTTDQNGIRFYVANSQPSTIKNNPSTTKLQYPANKEEYSGIGLENVRRRLELEYFEKHVLSIRNTEEEYAVELILLF